MGGTRVAGTLFPPPPRQREASPQIRRHALRPARRLRPAISLSLHPYSQPCAEKIGINSNPDRMNVRPSSLPSALIAVAALMVLLETLGFASLQPGYSHVANTISELGETGALHASLVAFGFF